MPGCCRQCWKLRGSASFLLAAQLGPHCSKSRSRLSCLRECPSNREAGSRSLSEPAGRQLGSERHCLGAQALCPEGGVGVLPGVSPGPSPPGAALRGAAPPPPGAVWYKPRDVCGVLTGTGQEVILRNRSLRGGKYPPRAVAPTGPAFPGASQSHLGVGSVLLYL